MGDVYYCDDYEAITGRERDGSMPVNDDGTISTSVRVKIVEAPDGESATASGVDVQTA